MCSEFLTRWINLRIGLLLFVLVFNANLVSHSHAQLFRKFGAAPQAPPVVFDQIPTQQQLMNHLQTRAELVKQLSASVSVSMAGVPAKIKGSLQVEFPNRMRLKAGFAGMTEMGVDVGSNEEQFWIWSRAPLPNQPPAFYYANHREYAQSAMRKSIPLDPKWLIEGLGLVEFEPTDVNFNPQPMQGGWVRFVTARQTPSGPQYRQILLNARTGLVAQQAIYDAEGIRVAYTNSIDYKVHVVGGQQVSLPQRVELFMSQPGQDDMRMEIKLSSVSLDPLYGAPEAMWAMPNPGRTQKINLAQVSNAAPSSVPRNPLPTRSRTQGAAIGYQRN